MGHNVIDYSNRMVLQFKRLFLFSPLLEKKQSFYLGQQARQPHATAGFQLPGAPGMQREPRGAAVEACV